MTWDALQREMLQALGHTLYVAAGSPAIQETTDADRATPDQHAPGRTAAPRSVPERASAGRNAVFPDALLHALLRAANLHVGNVALLQSQLPPLPALVGNVEAKRALWPMLRAMRAAANAADRDPASAGGK